MVRGRSCANPLNIARLLQDHAGTLDGEGSTSILRPLRTGVGILEPMVKGDGPSAVAPLRGAGERAAEAANSGADGEPGSGGRGRWGFRLGEWAVLGAFLGLVLLGSWNWAGEPPPPPELSAEDLETLEILRSLRDAEVGRELFMTSASSDRWMLDAGFDAPEDDATWMISTEARLEFTPVGSPARLIEIAVYPFLADSVPSRTLAIETSIDYVEWEMRGGGQLVSARLDPELEDQVVTLRCDSVDAPVDLGIGTDVRPLCLKLISVRLSP